jgi:hypothetical protein
MFNKMPKCKNKTVWTFYHTISFGMCILCSYDDMGLMSGQLSVHLLFFIFLAVQLIYLFSNCIKQM